MQPGCHEVSVENRVPVSLGDKSLEVCEEARVGRLFLDHREEEGGERL